MFQIEMATGESEERRLIGEGDTSGEIPLQLLPSELRITRNSLHNVSTEDFNATPCNSKK